MPRLSSMTYRVGWRAPRRGMGGIVECTLKGLDIVGGIMVLCVTRLYKPVLALRTSQSLQVRNPTTGMLFLIRIHFPHPPKYGSYGSYSQSLERTGLGSWRCVLIV